MSSEHRRRIPFDQLAISICIPDALVNKKESTKNSLRFNDPKSLGVDLEDYLTERREMTFRDPTDYNEFRMFISRYSHIYRKPDGEILIGLSDRQIDNVIKELRSRVTREED